MIKVMDLEYLTEKEAAARYGYSQLWFRKGRAKGYGPRFIQIKPFGRVLYPFHETDEWFRNKMQEKE